MNYLVSFVPDFIGADGKVYNAVWGSLESANSVGVKIGEVSFPPEIQHSATLVPCKEFSLGFLDKVYNANVNR